MKRMAFLLACVVAFPAIAIAQSRPEPLIGRVRVSPVLSVQAQTNLRAPDPACTCATPESSPVRSPYESECSSPASHCEDVHYAQYDARVHTRNPLGALLATHYVQTRVYDATLSFRGAAGDSTYRVRVGDIVPTPRGRARVVQVHRSFVENWDDGYVTLRLLEARASANVFVSTGAPSHARGVTMTMEHSNGGVATIVVVDGAMRTLDVKKGDAIATTRGTLRVADVVDGVMDGAIGWVEIESTAQ